MPRTRSQARSVSRRRPPARRPRGGASRPRARNDARVEAEDPPRELPEARADEENDELAMEEAERLDAVEQVARSMFRDGRSVRVEKLLQFMLDIGGQEAKEACENKTTNAAKLSLVWNYAFDPPLEDAEMLQWDTDFEDKEAAINLDPTKLSVRELRSFVINDMKGPESLADALQEHEVDSKILRDFTQEDVELVTGGDASNRRWLKRVMAKVTPQSEFGPVKSSANLDDNGSQKVQEALARADYQLAAALVKSMSDNSKKNRGIRRPIEIKRRAEPIDQFMQQMEHEEESRRHLEDGRANRQANRKVELQGRLGAGKTADGEDREVTFLEITIDNDTAMKQVKELLSPTTSTVKYDAAHRLRAAASGYEISYPTVKLNVPEGVEAALTKIDLITRNLRIAKTFNLETSSAFDHLRTLVRNYRDKLTPLEIGYLAEGGMRLALASTRQFERLFKPRTHTDSLPDAVRAKVQICASRKQKHLLMLAEVQSAIDKSKRPLVVQNQGTGYKRDRSGNTVTRSARGWRPWNERLQMGIDTQHGVRPSYKVIKLLKQRMFDLRAEGRYAGDECNKCCLYHPRGADCDLFVYPAFRNKAFKEIWQQGKNAGVLEAEVEEWNSRPRRLPSNRVTAEGKSISAPRKKGPGLA